MSSVISPRNRQRLHPYYATIEPEFDDVDITDVLAAIDKHGCLVTPSIGELSDTLSPTQEPAHHLLSEDARARMVKAQQRRQRHEYQRRHVTALMRQLRARQEYDKVGPVPKGKAKPFKVKQKRLVPFGPWRPLELPKFLRDQRRGFVMELVKGTNLYVDSRGIYFYAETWPDGTFDLFYASDGRKFDR